MASIIGQLRVVLSADSAQLSRTLKESQGKLSEFGTHIKTVTAAAIGQFALIAAAATAMSSAVVYAMNGSMDEFRKVGDASKQLDIPVEKLSALKYAAEASGSSFDTLSGAVGTLGGKIKEALTKPISEASEAFKGLGIELRDDDGKWRTSIDVLGDIADEFAKYRDGASKSAMATKLFGDAGKELIPFLNQGRDGIAALEAEARRLGVTFGKDTTEAAERYKDSINRLNAAKNSLWTQIATKLTPTMERISQRFAEVAKDGQSFSSVSTFLNNNLRDLAATGEIVAAVFRGIGSIIATVTEAIGFVLEREFAKAWDTIKTGVGNVKTIRDDLRREIDILYSGWSTTVKRAGEESAKGLMPWTKSTDDLAKALNTAKAELQALVGSTTTDAYDKQAAINEALKKGIIDNAEAIKLGAQVAAEAMRTVRDEARYAWDEIINAPTKTLQEKMEATKQALDAGTISLREFGRTTRQIQQENVRHWNDLASAVASGLTSIFGKSKTAAIAAAVINTAQAVTRNLAQYPMPFGGIMAAIAAASGAAQIRAIRSTNLSGSGGGDASAAAPATPAIPQQQTLFVQGISPNSLFTGDSVRDLAQKLIDYQRDGGRVILTQ